MTHALAPPPAVKLSNPPEAPPEDFAQGGLTGVDALDALNEALHDDKGLEYARGRFIRKNASEQSSFVGAEFLGELRAASIRPDRSRVARVYGADLIYRCWPEEPRHSRRPDVTVIRLDRLAGLPDNPGEMHLVPDLAIEIISPRDTARELTHKVQDYRRAGFPLLWVVEPDSRVCDVYDGGGVRRLGEDDPLTLPDLLPAFKHRLGDLLGQPVEHADSEGEFGPGAV